MSRLATRSPREVLTTQTAALPPPPRRPAVQVLAQEADDQVSLLFVDSYNHTRSVLAQACAELLRLRTLNAGRPNPFSRLDSAGLHLQSSLVTGSRPDGAPDQVGLRALFGARPSTQEQQDVERRLLTHRPRGITADDFAAHDYILAFDQPGLARLADLRQLVLDEADASGDPAPTAQILLLGAGVRSPRPCSVRLVGAGGRLVEADYASTIDGIRAELEGFMVRELGWPPLDGTAAAPFRSRQFVALARRVPSQTVMRHITDVCACRVWFDRTMAGEAECVVSVTAGAAHLEEAHETLRRRVGQSG